MEQLLQRELSVAKASARSLQDRTVALEGDAAAARARLSDANVEMNTLRANNEALAAELEALAASVNRCVTACAGRWAGWKGSWVGMRLRFSVCLAVCC